MERRGMERRGKGRMERKVKGMRGEERRGNGRKERNRKG
jgi:hypothetical protein